MGSLLSSIYGCATHDTGAEAFKHLSAKQILASGEQSLAKRNYKDASKYFEAIDALYPFDKEVQQSQLNLIYAYYKDSEIDSATAAVDRYIQLYPQGEHTDYAYYMKGIISYERGRSWFQKLRSEDMEKRDVTNMQKAFVNFNDLIKNFPNSVYVRDAYERMRHIRNQLAQQELNVAQYYFERKAYVAAANRASYIVKHIEGAQQTLEALKIMIRSYRAIGATDQANDTLQIMHLNYPNEKI